MYEVAEGLGRAGRSRAACRAQTSLNSETWDIGLCCLSSQIRPDSILEILLSSPSILSSQHYCLAPACLSVTPPHTHTTHTLILYILLYRGLSYLSCHLCIPRPSTAPARSMCSINVCYMKDSVWRWDRAQRRVPGETHCTECGALGRSWPLATWPSAGLCVSPMATSAPYSPLPRPILITLCWKHFLLLVFLENVGAFISVHYFSPF